MKKKTVLILKLCVILFLLFSCSKIFFKKGSKKISDSRYIEYISEYTSGIISNRSSIMIKLVKSIDLTNSEIAIDNKDVPENVFQINPKIKGKAIWEDDRTIVLYPEKTLPSGKEYKAVLNLSKLFKIPEDISKFEFNFSIKKQDFEVHIDDVTFSEENNGKTQDISGYIETADNARDEDVEKIISVKDIKDVKISWDHGLEENKHKFLIKDIARESKNFSVLLQWNGSPIDIDKKGKQKLTVYGLEDFNYIGHKLIQTPETYLKIQFSMPVDKNQNLNGLIRVEGDENPKLLIEDNIVRLYPSGNQKSSVNIIIDKNLKDVSASTLGKDIEFTVAFRQEKPQVKWVRKNGGVLPSTDGMIIPFEAISLKAIDVTVIEVYEDNIVQFLQVNKDIKGMQEIKRVGRPLVNKTFFLEKTAVKNLYEWNRFNLDLSDIINLKPGALYQIRINFRRSYSLYTCVSESEEEEIIEDNIIEENWDSEKEGSYWDYYDYYYDDYWENRDNPCNLAYYGKRREIAVNILASNLGIIAKGTDNGELDVFISDLITTDTLSGVEVEAYNYQQQLLASGKTDGKGHVSLKMSSVPFAIIAKKGKERGYLRVDDGTSLSMSSFDVGGSDSKKGIKGFIYGERGVWRPGDAVYLNFILEDKHKNLPDNHPIIFELRNPKGQLEKRIVKTDNIQGIYNFTFSTDSEAPTGNWRADVRVGGEVFSKKIKIETIKPNRLKIDLDFGKDILSVQDKELKGTIDVKWLHGAVAKNLNAEFDVILFPRTTVFNGYPGYSFDDPAAEFYPESENIFRGRLNENGKAEFYLSLGAVNSPGSLEAVFSGKVFEEGGDFSIDKLSLPYYPYESFVGIKLPPGDKTRGMLLTDQDHVVNIATVDSYGKPVSRKDLEIEVYKLSWKWWWDKSDEEISNYIGRSYNKRMINGTVNTVNGKATWKLRINYPEWGRYFIRVYDPVSSHSSGVIFYVDWPGWAGSAQKGELGGATMLSFYSDKSEYQVGEKANVTIPTSSKGRALVSIESGSKVIDTFWVETKEGKTDFDVNIKPEMAPNIYVHVTLIQPHGQVKNDLPIRLYGVLPIKVIDPSTKLEPVIEVADTLAPEKKVNIKVKEKNGRAMAYTIAVVDEGLLDLTNFQTPQPWDVFYSKEALGVKSWDIYDEVIGALTDNFGPLLAIGGGGELMPPGAQKASRFKPVVKFFGPFFLSKGQDNTHSFIMPRYIGSVKTMIVAAYDGAYGNASKTSFVKESLMVLGTMPRVLGPGEQIKLPVNLFVLDDNIHNVDVTVKTEGLIDLAGKNSQQIYFEKSGDQFLYFDLSTKEKIGIGKVFIEAKSGNEKATYEVELDVRPSNPVETDVYQGFVKPGNKWSQEINLVGIEGTNKQVIELSYLPPINLEKRLNFIIRYPHGCVEQITSSVFPQLYLEKIVQLDSKQKADIQSNVEAGIDKLKKFRTSSGGFGYWPGDDNPSDWATNYAGHFLVEAKNKGYRVPVDILYDWENYQKSTANKWQDSAKNSDDDLIQAYRLYTLALYGQPALGAMNRMKEKKSLEFRAKWRLAAAYAIIGKESVAEDLIKRLPTEVKEYNATSFTYGSSLRDMAMILETLVLMNKKESGFKLLKEIADKLGNDAWYSTQTTAYSLIAISLYGETNKTEESISAKFSFGDQSGVIKSEKSFVLKEIKSSKGILAIENTGKQVVYVRITSQGIPAVGKEREAENILSMDVVYKTKEGVIINDISKIKQGTDFIIETKITNSGALGDLEEIALTQIFPSGWEILNARLQETENYYTYDKPDYQDIRDDRVMTYFDLKIGKSKVFKIMLNAAYLGEFYLPGINCEAMYNNEIFSRKAGKNTSVIK